jgi:hypothetical protein
MLAGLPAKAWCSMIMNWKGGKMDELKWELKWWSHLPYEELLRRIEIVCKRGARSFEEQQCLDAAQESLKYRREPARPKRRWSMDDNPAKNDIATDIPAPIDTPEPAPKPKPRAKAKPKPKVKAEEPDGQKEKKVKRGVSKVRQGKARGKAVKKAKSGNSSNAARTRIDPDAKIQKIGDNTFRPGSGAFKRVETVFKYSGQTVKTVQNKAGLKPTTIRTMIGKGLIKLV